jgi:ribosomal protein L17
MRLAKLNRTMSHRRAMFRNLVSALIEHEQIKTTFPKAKAISRLAERVITWSKYGTENVFYQRKAESYLMVCIYLHLHIPLSVARNYDTHSYKHTSNRIGFKCESIYSTTWPSDMNLDAADILEFIVLDIEQTTMRHWR